MDRRGGDAAGKNRKERFVRKVLTPEEYRRFARSRDPELMLWSVWAAKEAAYKAVSKLWPEISGSPRRYVTVFEDGTAGGQRAGVVQTPAQAVYVHVMVRKEYVHCIGQLRAQPLAGNVVWGLAVIDPEPESKVHPDRASKAVRRAAKERMAACLGVPAAEIAIRRHPGRRGLGPPEVYIRDVKSLVDLSLSHHGRFAAYAFHADRAGASGTIR